MVTEVTTDGYPSTIGVLEKDDESVITFDPNISSGAAISIRWESFEPGHRFRIQAAVQCDGEGYQAFSPTLPGAATQGDSVEEAVKNLDEAASGCLASYIKAGKPIPWAKPLIDEEGEYELLEWLDVDV